MKNAEHHFTHRTGWLRAAVLGANDGIVSTASLILGVAAAGSSRSSILVAGMAGLVAGAMSMAAGEYVSVSSQSDTERADLVREREELAADGESEHAELAAIYVARGLDAQLADQVATQLMAKDALGAHARDELGISDTLSAHPIQAASASAGSFAAGAVLPTLARSRSATICARLGGLGQLNFLSRDIGFPGSPRGWGTSVESNCPCDLLGRARDGANCRSRRIIWSDSMRLFSRPDEMHSVRHSPERGSNPTRTSRSDLLFYL